MDAVIYYHGRDPTWQVSAVYILGGGWSEIGPAPRPMALAVKLKVPWDLANIRHKARIRLVDSDGNQVMVPTATMRHQPVVIEFDFETGRPPGAVAGKALHASVAINVGMLPLIPGNTYRWELTINDQHRDDWQIGFTVRPSAEPTAENGD
jgi:hypothetical protein